MFLSILWKLTQPQVSRLVNKGQIILSIWLNISREDTCVMQNFLLRILTPHFGVFVIRGWRCCHLNGLGWYLKVTKPYSNKCLYCSNKIIITYVWLSQKQLLVKCVFSGNIMWNVIDFVLLLFNFRLSCRLTRLKEAGYHWNKQYVNLYKCELRVAPNLCIKPDL